tara:strand:- start:144 stop:281 length:138 start_codon:yes stop_codon:yes gene_type:complete
MEAAFAHTVKRRFIGTLYDKEYKGQSLPSLPMHYRFTLQRMAFFI